MSNDITIGKNSGAAMLELAIILPILIILLFGFIEIGRVLYQENTLTKALTAGTRYIARVPGAVSESCQPGTSWAGAVNQGRNLIANEADGGVRLPGLDSASAISFNLRLENIDEGNACIIRSEAEVEFESIFGTSIVPFLNLGPLHLNASVEERYIGE